jgi:hypothetical protein
LYALLHNFATLVHHLELALHYASIRIGCLAFFQHLEFDVDRVAGLDRFGELQTVKAKKRDKCVVVKMELEHQSCSNRVNKRPLDDASAKLCLLAILLIDVQRIVVA